MSARLRPELLPASVWRADTLGAGVSPGLPSGFGPLDAQLPGGGWPAGTLTELITRDAGVGELRLLVPLLRRLTAERRTVVLLAPPHLPDCRVTAWRAGSAHLHGRSG